MDEFAHFGTIKVPLLGIRVEQLILILYPLAIIPTAIALVYQFRQRRQNASVPKGYRRLGLRGKSNIADEYDDKYAEGSTPKIDETVGKVKALFVYPIKSCAGVEVDSAELYAGGLKYDRDFAFAELEQPKSRDGEPKQAPLWTFRTMRARGYEKLALVRPEIWLPISASQDDEKKLGKDGIVVIHYPNVPSGNLALLDRFFINLGMLPKEFSFQVPLLPPTVHNYPTEEINVWFDYPQWFNYARHVPADFKRFVGAKNDFTLFRVDPDGERQVMRCAPRKEELGYQPTVGAADGYPVHLLNLASVRDVATKVKDDLPRFTSRRYRSNILITGPAAYEEDNWKRARIGEHEMYCSCHTVRCKLPNVDPDTGFKHRNEPDSALRKYRCIDPGAPGGPCLGLQLVPAKNEGVVIRAGDAVTLLESGAHQYIPQIQNKRPGYS